MASQRGRAVTAPEPATSGAAPSACARTLQHLHEADDVAKDSESKLRQQNRQLERMAADLNRINGGLDQTDRHMREMERSYVESVAHSGMKGLSKSVQGLSSSFGASLGSSRWGGASSSSAGEVALDPGGAPMMSGWLAKRGPMFNYKWERRWVVLCPKSLAYYSDSSMSQKRGEVELTLQTVAASFRSDGAPGDALRHRGERPLGFVVAVQSTDATPDDEVQKNRFFYFETEDEASLKAWLRAFQRATRDIKGKDLVELPAAAPPVDSKVGKRSKGPDAATAAALDEITALARGLNDRVDNMHQDVVHQDNMVNRLNEQTSKTNAKFEDQHVRAEKLTAKARDDRPPAPPISSPPSLRAAYTAAATASKIQSAFSFK